MKEADKYAQEYDSAIEIAKAKIDSLLRDHQELEMTKIGWAKFEEKGVLKRKKSSLEKEIESQKNILSSLVREKEIFLSYPPHVVPSVREAFRNTAEQRLEHALIMMEHIPTKPSRYLTNDLLDQLAKKYMELELLSTDELKRNLVMFGVLNEDGTEAGFPEGDDIALMLSIYVRRFDKEKLELDRVRSAHRRISDAIDVAPGLVRRAELEKERETIESRLQEINEDPDDSFNWSLKKIGGEVRVYTRGGDAVAAVFTLGRGVYRLDVKDEDNDGRTPQRLRIEDTPYELKISPPVKRGEIEITGENGITDTIPLY